MDRMSGANPLYFLEKSDRETEVLQRFADEAGACDLTADPGLPDWEIILLDLREQISGPTVSARLVCPHCNTKVALIFNTRDLPTDQSPSPGQVAGVKLSPLRRSDVLAAEKLSDPEQRLALFLQRASGQSAEWAAEIMTGDLREMALMNLEKAAAGLDLSLATHCTDCGKEIAAGFDVARFFYDEMHSKALNLLDEIHVLASSYHWSEVEILALPEPRRRAYLDRVTRSQARNELFHAG